MNWRPLKTLAFLAALQAARLGAQQANPPAQPAPATPAGPEPIPLTQIAVRGEELSRILRDISRSLPSEADLAAFEEEFGAQEERVGAKLKESSAELDGNLTIMQIREEMREWRAYGAPESRQRRTLSAWGAACEDSIRLLKQHQAVWRVTLSSTKELAELDSLRARVRLAAGEIRGALDVAEQRLRTVVDLQGRVSKKAVAVADMLQKLSDVNQRVRKRLFRPDGGPIWRAQPLTQTVESARALLAQSLARPYSASAEFLKERYGQIALMIVLLTLALWGIHWFARAGSDGRSADPVVLQAGRVLRRPLSVAVLLVSPVIFTSLPLAQISVALLLIQLFLLPVVRLLPIFVGSTAWLVYWFSGFCGFNTLIDILDIETVVRRRLLAILYGAAVAMLVWWGRPERLRRSAAARTLTLRELRLVRWSAGVLGVILLTNVFGFLVLANLLRVTIVISTFIGLAIYTLMLVTSALVTSLLHWPRLRSLATIRMYEPALVRWIRRILGGCAFVGWLYVTLNMVSLRESVVQSIGAVLGARVGIKAFSISLGDVLGFGCVLILGILAAGGIRFILRQEILARMHLSRGLPEVISTLLYYVLLLLVFLMSLSAAGVQLDKLTLLTGAFGVGVGFGMQNLVNNFVSGLILQFERPIRIGDILEVGALGGEVRRIGIRSSTIRTFQGAEVIIPNATLVSDQVVNWTLSEARRRVDIPVRVAFGAEPERVMAILSGVAAGHPEVLRDPEPGAYFQGFGQSALEFVLQFWADQATHFRLRSEVSIRVNAALRQAGIEIPLPQHDIRVLGLERRTRQDVGGNGATSSERENSTSGGLSAASGA